MHPNVRPWWISLFSFALALQVVAAEPSQFVAQELRRFVAPEATQAVAVDATHFYAIDNRVIAKYAKSTGQREKTWTASAELPLEHLDSGVVLGDKLYCAHSNFPRYPENSSVEIWDTATLQHVGTHSFGIYEGSLTWIDRHDDAWWAVFAHYSEKVNDDPRAKDSPWTSLVRFDGDWRRTAGWVFPAAVTDRFEPHSCSGGSWGSDGRLYCTGHDRGELYDFALPRAGSTLELKRTIDVPFTGQGFAWDRSEPGVLYGIDRPRGEVIVLKLSMPSRLLPTGTESAGQR
jgi:outer membrane protein assembly factor BamB